MAAPKFKNGFTLIELLVVMSIIALLLTIGLSFYGNAQRATRDAKRRGDLDAIRKSLEVYRAEHGSYRIASTFPCTSTTATDWYFGDSLWGVSGTTTGCASSLKNGLASYFVNSSIPMDPQCPGGTCSGTAKNYVITESTSDSFIIMANLENAPTTVCAGAYAGYNYCVYSQN